MAHMLPWGSLEILVERYLPVTVIWLSYCHWCLCNAGSVWWGGPTFIIAAIYPYIELPLLLARVETEKLSQMHDSTKWSSHIYVQFRNKSLVLVIYYQLIALSSLDIFRHILVFWNYAIQHVIQNVLQSVQTFNQSVHHLEAKGVHDRDMAPS